MFTLNANPIKKELNASDLKLVAIITMLIDHIGAAIVERAMRLVEYKSASYNILNILDQIMRSIGRMAFPIFTFFIAVGFMHTRNKWKYLSRLIIFGIISEVPFDLSFAGTVYNPGYQNVYFTLALGLLAIIGRDFLKKVKMNENLATMLRFISFALFGMMFFFTAMYSSISNLILQEKKILFFNTVHLWGLYITIPDYLFILVALGFGVLSLIIFSIITGKKEKESVNKEAISWFIPYLCMILAQFASTDYGAKGIIVVVVAYSILEMKSFNNDAMVYSVLAISIFNPGELCALLDVFLTDKYNGQKGNMNKYVFYLFYPVHLLILGLIANFFLVS